MFVVHVDGRGYVEKNDGANFFHRDPRRASTYPDRDAAEAGKVGHHRDMGGSGFKGRIVPCESAARSYKARCR